MFLIILYGMLLGFFVFAFTYTASKRNGKYYLAPIITFLMVIGITLYGLFFVRGFEGMAYGILALGFLIISIVGTLLLIFFTRRESSKQFKRNDKILLCLFPIMFFLTIGWIYYSNEVYWIIDQGITDGIEEGYTVSTISEGKKEILLLLGEEYLGKEIEIKKVSKRGPTEIILEIVEGDNINKAPYIRIGLDEINEPLKIQTTDGVVFYANP